MVSDFGIGPWRKANEEFVACFEPSYCLFEQRIGAPSSVNLARGSRYENGGVLRTQRCYPGPYEVHAMAPNGISQVKGSGEEWIYGCLRVSSITCLTCPYFSALSIITHSMLMM